MKRIFQKFRRQLIAEANFSKYTLYALGEFMLIVAGILMALQIDNWNTHNNEIEDLIKSYEQIEQSLVVDLANINAVIDYHTSASKSANKARKHLKAKKEWTIELSNWITDADNLLIYTPQSSTFEAIKRNGIELIENIWLKDQLIRVYEELTEAHKRKESILEYIRNHYYNVWETKNLDRHNSNLYWEVINYDAILYDYEFQGNLLTLVNRHRGIIETAENLSTQIQSLKRHIAQEITRLKKGAKLPESRKSIAFSNEGIMLLDGRLRLGLDYGADTSEKVKNWVSNIEDTFHISYPAKQKWGVFFITTGRPTNPPRRSENFSKYKKVFIEMKGDLGGEIVDIALKDKFDPTDGSEDKFRLTLTNDWKTYEIDIASNFASADLEQLYIITSFVFDSAEAQEMSVKKIYFK